MGPVMTILGVLGISSLFKKRRLPSSTARPATLGPPLLLVLGLAGIAAYKASQGTLRAPR